MIYITEELYKNIEKIRKTYLDEEGREVGNPTPLVHHTGINRPLTLQEQIQRLIKHNLAQQAYVQGMETFDEANDFDAEESTNMDSKYTIMDEEPPPSQAITPQPVDSGPPVEPAPTPPEPPEQDGGDPPAAAPKPS